MKKGIATGESDFRNLIENDCFYIDKTQWIEELIKDRAAVKLFTRPRRFGKTLNMTTLKYFFSMKNAEENKKLFEGLDISKSEYFKYQGQYPVIFLSLKDVKQSTWENSFRDIKDLIDSLYSEYKDVRESLDLKEQKKFDKIYFDEEETEYKKSLKFLCECIYKHYNKKPILLIDEYDTPIVSAYMYGYFDGEARDFLRDFYSTVLKDNEYLEMAVLTGIVRVAKEGIFSGLNNLQVYDTFRKEFPSYFGLTQKEVEEALKYYELEYDIDKVKQWYDGYNFGGLEIYNPWSILHYIKAGELGAYWVNTSSNDLIIKLLKQSGNDVFKELKILFSDGMIEKSINKNFNFNEMNNSKGLWELFVFSGYLKLEKKVNKDINDDLYLLKIPNLEVKTFFHRSFIESFLDSMDTFREMLNALKKKDEEIFTERLQTIFNVSISYYDVGKEEKYYHNILLGMILSLQKEYDITSNRESGSGRYDIVLEPKDRNKTAFVLEFKVGDNEEELEKLSQVAIEQIEKKEYASSMKAKGINDILAVGIAFYKKKIRVKFEEI